jgi:hypothetical protein
VAGEPHADGASDAESLIGLERRVEGDHLGED